MHNKFTERDNNDLCVIASQRDRHVASVHSCGTDTATLEGYKVEKSYSHLRRHHCEVIV